MSGNYLYIFIDDLIKKAKEIKDKIMTFLATHKVTSPLPRANDTFIIPFLTPTEDDSITENSKFELATYLALNYPRLCDVSQDASSLLHDTVEFVSNYRHDFKGNTNFKSIKLFFRAFLNFMRTIFFNA